MIVHSVQEYLNTIEKLKHNYTYSARLYPNPLFGEQIYTPRFIFRGHGDHANYGLLPGVLRWRSTATGGMMSEYSQMEHNILKDFISEACRYLTSIPTNDIPAWLEMAQHFGVPTRLLDFTQNPLVALYFACEDKPDKDASVWIINEQAYNGVFFNSSVITDSMVSENVIQSIITEEIVYSGNVSFKESRNVLYPWIYKPHYHEERMNTQASVFMLWGQKRNELTQFMLPQYYMTDSDGVENQQTGVIGNILIPAEKKKGILVQLDLCGINEKFIYPGLDGVGRYIKKKYSSGK